MCVGTLVWGNTRIQAQMWSHPRWYYARAHLRHRLLSQVLQLSKVARRTKLWCAPSAVRHSKPMLAFAHAAAALCQMCLIKTSHASAAIT